MQHISPPGHPSQWSATAAQRLTEESLPLTQWCSIAHMLNYEPLAGLTLDDAEIEALRFKLGDFAAQRGQLLESEVQP